MFQKLDLFPSSGERMGDAYSIGSVRKSKPQSLDHDFAEAKLKNNIYIEN
jgi:hypothetical protein